MKSRLYALVLPALCFALSLVFSGVAHADNPVGFLNASNCDVEVIIEFNNGAITGPFTVPAMDVVIFDFPDGWKVVKLSLNGNSMRPPRTNTCKSTGLNCPEEICGQEGGQYWSME